MASTLEETVQAALGGSRDALEAVVRTIQGDVHKLALRMLWHPADAEDATQEILIKVVTRLSSFRGESAFSTWVFRVACNHLLNVRKSRAEARAMTFESFAEALDEGLDEGAIDRPLDPDRSLLATEIMVACTNGMLLCLDRDHRMAYILGELIGFEGDEAAAILEVPAATFRKRLSRARARLHAFMEEHCGLVDESAPCRCERQIEAALAQKRVDAQHRPFTSRPAFDNGEPSLPLPMREIQELHRTVRLFRGHPEQAPPKLLLENVRALIDSGRLPILSS